MIERILVPLDGSRFAEAALTPALDIARRAGCNLHLVAAQEEVPAWVYPGLPSVMTEWRGEYFDQLLAELGERTTVEITTATPDGHVAEEIELEAERVDADLVIMATHGRGPLSRTWLGSVADSFVRCTRRPVLMMRPPEDPEAEPEWRGAHRVLVPLDGSGLAEAALPAAMKLGRVYDASYHLVRVVHFPVAPASPYIPHTAEMNQEAVDEQKAAAREYVEAVRDRLVEGGADVDCSVVVAPHPARGILAVAAERGCTLVAMATHGSRLRRLALGSTSDKVLRTTELPLLLVRPGGEEGDEA